MASPVTLASPQRLKAVLAEGNRVAAGGVAFHLAALAFAKFHPFGH